VKNKAAFVFSTNGETAVSGFSRAKERLDEEMLEIAKADAEERFDNPKDVAIEPFTIHDLRRSFASGLARLGVRLEVIERCLNHVSGSFGGIVGVYQQHDFAKECAEAWELWAKHIAKTIKPS
jgi:integrase